MTRFVKTVLAAAVLAVAVGCGDDAKPANKADTQPSEKAIQKEKMPYGKG
jgi:hypothetical protein